LVGKNSKGSVQWHMSKENASIFLETEGKPCNSAYLQNVNLDNNCYKKLHSDLLCPALSMFHIRANDMHCSPIDLKSICMPYVTHILRKLENLTT
jgi:hypothetical protein